MKQVHKHLLIASLLATLGLGAVAQMPPAGGAGPGGQGPMMGRMAQGDPARMEAQRTERHARKMADLKTRLQITPAQEGAWTTFATGMQPPARLVADRAQFRAEMEKLTTPERIDKMQALKAQRDAAMTQRGNATKTFYAVLTPAQQKVFDLESLNHGAMGGHAGGRHGMGMGPHHGMGMGYGPGAGMGHGQGMGYGPGMGMGMGMGPARN